jgi:hypothetical protein
MGASESYVGKTWVLFDFNHRPHPALDRCNLVLLLFQRWIEEAAK